MEELTEDPDPTLEDETKFLARPNSDPHSLSINTVRGEAMHAVVQYALWTRRAFEKAENREALVAGGFAEMPEVRHVLERHLDPGIDRSLTVRFVYGRWLPLLHLLDREWVQENLPLIFPTVDNLQTLCDCAWTTYIVLCDPYNELFRAIEPLYLRATEMIERYDVGEIAPWGPGRSPGSTPCDVILARDNTAPVGSWFVRQFYANATDKLRGSVTGFIGRTLKNETREIPIATIEKLQALWETRIETALQRAVTIVRSKRNYRSSVGGLRPRDRMMSGAWTNCWRSLGSQRR